jgi:hypothetical protein
VTCFFFHKIHLNLQNFSGFALKTWTNSNANQRNQLLLWFWLNPDQFHDFKIKYKQFFECQTILFCLMDCAHCLYEFLLCFAFLNCFTLNRWNLLFNIFQLFLFFPFFYFYLSSSLCSSLGNPCTICLTLAYFTFFIFFSLIFLCLVQNFSNSNEDF